MTPEQEFIIGPQRPINSDPLAGWYDATAIRQGKYWAARFLADPVYVSSNHYDLPLCLYILYYRTGDAEFLSLARQVAEKWFNSPYINQGHPVAGPDQPGALYSSLSGLMLYALDTNRAGVWGYLDQQAKLLHQQKVMSRIGNLDPDTGQPSIVFDLRESGYAQRWAVELARVLPDEFDQMIFDDWTGAFLRTERVTNGAERRAKYLADAERAAVDYFGRSQHTDGSWRWNLWIDPFTKDMEQPFQVGMYLESAIQLHQLTQNETVKASLASQITKACDHLYRDTYRVNIEPGLTSIPRVTTYFWPLALNSFDYQASDRHLTTTNIHAFGYAYKLTGDIKYLTQGDELWDSCFAVTPKDKSPLTGDPLRSLMDAPNYMKLFTGEVRSSGMYLALRKGAAVPPEPIPIPIPIPSPIPTPTPQPIPACVISGPDSIRVPKNGTGVININVSNVSGPVTVTHTGSGGGVQVTPPSKTATVSSNILAFQVRVKKQSRTITFNSPCGSKTVMVNVQ